MGTILVCVDGTAGIGGEEPSKGSRSRTNVESSRDRNRQTSSRIFEAVFGPKKPARLGQACRRSVQPFFSVPLTISSIFSIPVDSWQVYLARNTHAPAYRVHARQLPTQAHTADRAHICPPEQPVAPCQLTTARSPCKGRSARRTHFPIPSACGRLWVRSALVLSAREVHKRPCRFAQPRPHLDGDRRV